MTDRGQGEDVDQLPQASGQRAGTDPGEQAAAEMSVWGMRLALAAVLLVLMALVLLAVQLLQDPIAGQTSVSPPPQQEEGSGDPVEAAEAEAEEETERPVITHGVDVELFQDIGGHQAAGGPGQVEGRTDETAASHPLAETATFFAVGSGGPSSIFGNRWGGAKRRALGAYGGSRAAENAVDAALRWLQRHQSPNGMWDISGHPVNCDLPGPKSEPGIHSSGPDGDSGATGYAVLAFLGAGYDHRTPNKYRRVVQGGIDWLVANQLADGSFGRTRNYENGICTMALVEAYGMTHDPDLQQPAQRAVNYLLLVQNRQGVDSGALGWDYHDNNSRNDSSVSGWPIMALKSAEAAGLSVGQGLDGARQYFIRAWNATNNAAADISDPSSDRSGFPYVWDSHSDETTRPDRSAIGLYMGVFLGKGSGNIMSESLANDVMARAFVDQDPDYQIATWPVNTYYLYYNTLALFQMGGARWQRWNDAMRDFLVEHQVRSDDCLDGSWDWKETRFHGHGVGRIVSTTYAAMSLQSYYRYAPLREMAEQ